MANQPSTHARILVADALKQIAIDMAYEAIIEEWRYEINRDMIAKACSHDTRGFDRLYAKAGF